MMDALVELTSLPNLHPALVHFPIALLPVAVLFDLLSQRRRWIGLAPGATVLYALAALGAWAAYQAGESAVDSLGLLGPQVQLHLNEHSDLGRYSFWLLSAIAAVRIGLDLWDRERARRVPRLLLSAAALGALGLVFWTADLGGALVYRHGVAVAAVDEQGAGSGADDAALEEGGEAPAGGGPVESRLVSAPGGGVVWRPLAADGAALGSVLTAAAGSDLGAVSWVASESEEQGLTLAVDGEAWMVLPGSYGDVQVTLELVLEEFSGEVGPVHHVRSAEDGGFFLIGVPSAGFALGSVEGGERRELDRQSGSLPAGPLTLTVSAIGRHLKGMVGNETVVHGHEPALPQGACGVAVRGRGRLRILKLAVAPAS